MSTGLAHPVVFPQSSLFFCFDTNSLHSSTVQYFRFRIMAANWIKALDSATNILYDVKGHVTPYSCKNYFSSYVLFHRVRGAFYIFPFFTTFVSMACPRKKLWYTDIELVVQTSNNINVMCTLRFCMLVYT